MIFLRVFLRFTFILGSIIEYCMIYGFNYAQTMAVRPAVWRLTSIKFVKLDTLHFRLAPEKLKKYLMVDFKDKKLAQWVRMGQN